VKRVLLTTAALAAAVVVLIIVSLPPRQQRLQPADDGAIAGVMHVHTNRSDGRSDPDTVAAAAARAGLRFVVFTDHGDGTREPDPPTYRSGVLCIDAVEISTDGGHYVAIGLPRAPYPLRGDPRDVVEDVARMGGFGIAAHPDSPKRDLQWGAWAAPFDGIELVNTDTSWRVHAGRSVFHSVPTLLSIVAAYPFRSPETLSRLLTANRTTIRRWLEAAQQRPIVAVAGADAHAQIGLWEFDPIDTNVALPLPGYETSFRSLTVHVRPTQPWTGTAATDFAALLGGLRAGHAYIAIDGLATPASLTFTARNEHGTAAAGDTLEPRGPLTLDITTNAPPAFAIRVWKDGEPFGPEYHEPHVQVAAESTGVFTVDVRGPDQDDRAPWLISNPIYVRKASPRPSSEDAARWRPPSTATLKTIAGWRAETDPASRAETVSTAGGVQLDFSLAPAPARMTHAGAVGVVAGAMKGCEGMTFTIRGERPMRVVAAIRTSFRNVAEEQWHRSVYVDQEPRHYAVSFGDLTPVSANHSPRPPVESMAEVMWVVDDTHAIPGASGRVLIDDVTIACGPASR